MSQIHHRPPDMRSIRHFVLRRWHLKALSLFLNSFFASWKSSLSWNSSAIREDFETVNGCQFSSSPK
ncbi:hypothetical protein QF001_002007 [Paraburkholderia youngii]|uniref:Uncharacterized protein n=1 Tax=Paraburkholderia youngii TaxID=2782701 RepID=A0A7Y6JXK1_9BURK|nr:hypothetical protein [Paraburkholderia youngii]